MKPLLARISNRELLDLYGYEQWSDSTIAERWKELCADWDIAMSGELGAMRQQMLLVHLELCPSDNRWVAGGE